MEYFLTEEQEAFKKLARRFAEQNILPVRAELDESEEFPWDIIKEFAKTDMFGVHVPEEYRGLGGGCLGLCLVTEELSRVCSSVAISYAASALGSFTLLEYGTEEQKQRYLPDIASGKKLAAFALTESEAGSDAGAIKTTAEKVNGGYLLNGTKQFITNGGEAEIYTVIALTDKAKGPRGFFSHIDVQDQLVITAPLGGIHLDVIKIFEPIQISRPLLEARAAEPLLFAYQQLPANDLITGSCIAAYLNLLKIHHGSLINDICDVGLEFL